jgi:inner membrane protein
MMFVTHLSFGLLLGLLAIKFLNLPVNMAVLLMLLLIGSYGPDIDSGSVLTRKGKPLRWFIKHRGPTHSLLSLVLFSLIVLLITSNWYYALAFAIGYLFHLLMDSITPTGVPMLWPSKERMRGKIKTTGMVDVAVLGILLALDIALFLYL